MRRRPLLATATATALSLAGCTTSAPADTTTENTPETTDAHTADVSASQNDVTVTEWVDAETDPHAIPYSAAYVRVDRDEPPRRSDLRLAFDDGERARPDAPEDPEIYRDDHATNLYDRESAEGWILATPDRDDDRDERLEAVVVLGEKEIVIERP